MTNSVLTVNNITKVIGERTILKGVSFSLAPQTLTSIIGPNGAGKSTLLKIILNLDHDYEGQVSLAKGQRVGYIPQSSSKDHYALPISVREYLSVGSTPLYRKSSADLATFSDALRHVGVDPQLLNQTVGSLSGGEHQRVAIARALLADPTILVLDEPLAAVDYESRHDLYQLIRHLQQDHGITVILVSHDLETVVPLSDQVLCLNQTLNPSCHVEGIIDDHHKVGVVHHH